MPRKILVIGGNAGPIHFVEREADNEEELQTVLLRNSQLIPAEDLGLEDDLLVVGRETTLASGSVDLLCLSKGGELVIIEFKTGPQNPDFRHALAQVIDYGSDLWKLSGWTEFDKGVVHRYLKGKHVYPTKYAAAADLREAAVLAWELDDEEWDSLVLRLGKVLATGDFYFVVAAQRFTDQMKDSVRYLNAMTHYGKYFLVELVRLDGKNQKAYAAQVVEKPTARSEPASRANEDDFLAAIGDTNYREAMRELFYTVSTLGLVLSWGTKGASIRLKSHDDSGPISVGWVYLEGDQRAGARHVTFGVEPPSLNKHPTIAPAITAFCEKVKQVPDGKPAGNLNARTFEPSVFPSVKDGLFALLEELKENAEAAVPSNQPLSSEDALASGGNPPDYV